MRDLTTIGIDSDKLKKARERASLTQAAVAQAVGVQKAAISKIECGLALPSADVLARMCKLYQVDIAAVSSRAA